MQGPAGTAIPLGDLYGAAIAALFKNAEEDVADAKTDGARAKANEALDHLRILQAPPLTNAIQTHHQ